MNIRKIVLNKYFLIFFPVFILNIILMYIYYYAEYSLSLDYWKTLKIAGYSNIYNYLINPFYQLIINIIYNIKEKNENYFKNIILMAISCIFGTAITYIVSIIELISKLGYYYISDDEVGLIYLNLGILFIIIILGVIEKFILTKIFNKIKNK